MRSATGKEEWDLSNADLRPGARIAYWLEATDIDTVSGPKVSQTRPRYLRVYSPELKHKEALRQLSQVLEHGIRVLGDRLLLFEKEPPLAPSLRFDKADLVNKGQLMLRDGLRELSNKLRQDPLATPSLRRSLAKMNRRLLPLVNAEGQAIKGLRPLRRRQQLKEAHLRPLRDGNGRLSVEMERSVLLLADLLNDQRLQGLSRRAKELRQGRARLKELLTRYRKTPSAALKKQILRLIRQLEAQARKLMAEASRLQGAIPDEYLNTEAMAKLDLKEQLQRISDQVRKGELDKLESAMSALDRSLDKLEGMLGQGSQQFRETRMAEQERQYSEVLDRLRGLEREQRQISGKTSKVIRRYRKRAADMMKKTIQPFIRRQLTRLADLTKKVEEINGKILSAYDQEQLQRIRQRLGELKGLLEQLDLDEALRNSRRARNGLRVLEDDLGEDIEDPYAFGRKDLRKSHRRSRAARKLADEMVADLEAIFPSPSTILGSDDRKEVQKLVRREQNLRRQAKQLENHLAKGGKEGNGQPFISPGLLKKLEDAGQQMGKAGGKMRGMRLQESQGSRRCVGPGTERGQGSASAPAHGRRGPAGPARAGEDTWRGLFPAASGVP